MIPKSFYLIGGITVGALVLLSAILAGIWIYGNGRDTDGYNRAKAEYIAADTTVKTTTSSSTTFIPQPSKKFKAPKPKLIIDSSYQHLLDSLNNTKDGRNKDSLIAFYEVAREYTWGDSMTIGAASIKIFPALGFLVEPRIIPAPMRVDSVFVDREVTKTIYIEPTFWQKTGYRAQGAVVIVVGVAIYIWVHN